MQTVLVLFRGNTQVLQVSGVQDQISGLFQNSATVTATLNDANGNPVSGMSGLSLTYVPGSNGQYQATVSSTFNPAAGDMYTLILDVASGGSAMHIELPSSVQVRRS